MELNRHTRRRDPVRPHLYAVGSSSEAVARNGVDLDPRPAEVDRGPGLETSEAEWLQRDPDAEGLRVFRGVAWGLALTAGGAIAVYGAALLLNFALAQ